MSSLRRVLALCLPAIVAACADEDVTAPPVPYLELAPEVTSRATLILEGSAEYGASVKVTRDPTFTEAPAPVTADLITGRFRVTVALAEGVDNTFSVVAVDAAQNSSPAVNVKIFHEPPRPQTVRLTPSATLVSADDGKLAVLVQIGHREPEISLDAMEVELSVEGYTPAVAPVVVKVNASGVGEGVLEGLSRAGSGTVVATAVKAAPDGTKASDRRGFVVVSGRPASVTLLLAATVDGSDRGPAASLSVPAGTEVTTSVEVVDAKGNVLVAPPLSLVTDAPGALIAGSTVARLERAGTYQVWANLSASVVTGTASLVVEPAAAAAIRLVATPSEVLAGTAVAVEARVVDRFGNTRADAVSLTEDLEVSLTALTTEAGITRAQLVPQQAGTFTVTGAFGGLTSADATLVVLPAAPVTFGFELDLTRAPFAAGAVIPFTYAVLDAFGNRTSTPVVVTVDAPAATVLVDGAGRGEISGIVRTGTYSVRARAVGTAFEDTETVVIGPSPRAGFDLVLSSALLVEGSKVSVLVRDGFGNAIGLDQVALDVNGVPLAMASGVSLSGSQLTFTQAGNFQVRATLLADTAISDTELLAVQAVADVVPPTAAITAILFPAGATVPARGTIRAALSLGDNRSLAEAEVLAQFGETPACAASSGRLVLVGQTAATPAVSVRAPTCATPRDVVSLVVRVSDQAGNIGFSATNTTLRMYAPAGFDVTAGSSAYVSSVVAYANRIDRGDTPTDLAVSPTSDVIYVTHEGSDRIVVAFPDRTQDDLRDTSGNRFNFDKPQGVAVTQAGDLFVGVVGVPTIDGVPADLSTVTRGVVDTGGRFPGRINLDEEGPVALLCVAYPLNGSVRCYRSFLSTPMQVFEIAGLTLPVAADVSGGALWILERGGCRVRRAALTYTPGTGAVTAGTPSAPFTAASGGTCVDLVSIGADDVAVLDDGGGKVARVRRDGSGTFSAEIVASVPSGRGLDFAGGRLFVLDDAFETVFAITPVSGSF